MVEETGASIRVETDTALLLNADRQLISQALTNLLENAMKYGVPAAGSGASNEIAMGARRTPVGLELWVSDQGPGIHREDSDRVLKRFVRLDAARSKPGTGLGLSLVAAVIRQHGGTIKLADNHPGLKVILNLPHERLAANVLTSKQAGPAAAPTGTMPRTPAAIGET